MKRGYFKMLKKEESKKVAAKGNSNMEPLGEKGEVKRGEKRKMGDPVTARKMAAAFEARRKDAERKQMKVRRIYDERVFNKKASFRNGYDYFLVLFLCCRPFSNLYFILKVRG